VENVWQFMRDNWLSNRVFKSYDDLVDHCCNAWNKLVDQPWRIMSWTAPMGARVLIKGNWYKCSPLTVLLWPQVQNYSLTKSRLILAHVMASAIQRFRGSNQRVGHQPTGRSMPTLAIGHLQGLNADG